MTVNVKVTSSNKTSDVQAKISDGPVKVTITKEIISRFHLDAREAINGDIMIFDHKDIDIIILKEKKKVIAFAKDLMSEEVYGAENRLMTYLKKQGIIAYDSIQGGNVYGSLEASVLQGQDLNMVRVLLKNISEWMEEEKPMLTGMEEYEDMLDDYMTDPDDDNSTPLGKVPQEAEKGSIRYKGMYSPYSFGAYLYESKEPEDK